MIGFEPEGSDAGGCVETGAVAVDTIVLQTSRRSEKGPMPPTEVDARAPTVAYLICGICNITQLHS